MLGNGSEAVVILDSANVVWSTTYAEGTANGWQPWTQVGGILQDVAPAAIGGKLYLAGKALDGGLWWWRQTGSQWTSIGNSGAAAGALAAAPSVSFTPSITSLSPSSAPAGVPVTITGIDFGATQGNSTVTFNGISAGQASSWSAGSITVLVPGGAVTGAVVVTVGGSASNPVSFALPPPPGGNLVVPSLLNMSVGDTHTIQAINAAWQPVTGLTWTSSNPAIVSLSTDDPPLLTALAAGHVNITAGTGSGAATAAVTVFAGPLPLGTPIWSNPGDGSGVQSIVPAVPSTSGVADVFAFQADGTVQAITSDGTHRVDGDRKSAGARCRPFCRISKAAWL